MTRLSDGKGVGNAVVAARDRSGREVFTGKTDGAGLCGIPEGALRLIDDHGSIDDGLVLFEIGRAHV